MSNHNWWALAVVVTVLAWSVVMTAMGQAAAIATLIPLLALLLNQIVRAVTSRTDPPPGPRHQDHKDPPELPLLSRKEGPLG